MSNPKISVLIPMYNGKHYIEQCIDSVLNQTFQDFEIIVRDDGSTDGSADFVAERYDDAISSGKLKLRRNEKNIGEFPTDNRLLHEAKGKYIMILHNDDLYLSKALEHLYMIAEHFNADVVHGSNFFTTTPDGIIKKDMKLILNRKDKNQVKEITVMSNEPTARFDEWANNGTFHDVQYNIFRRKFLTDNKISFAPLGNSFVAASRLFALKWIMKAEVFVKTPTVFYLKRESPDCVSNMTITPDLITKFITDNIELSRYLDEFFTKEDFFKDNQELQYRAVSKFFLYEDNFWLQRTDVYKNGITAEVNQSVADAFKKYFGDYYAFPTFLFHWIHAAIKNRPVDKISNLES